MANVSIFPFSIFSFKSNWELPIDRFGGHKLILSRHKWLRILQVLLKGSDSDNLSVRVAVLSISKIKGMPQLAKWEYNLPHTKEAKIYKISLCRT